MINMTDRRTFVKTLAAGSGSLLASASALADSSAVLPSIVSLLLDDDSNVVDCSDVAISEFSVRLEFDNAFSGGMALELETPGGSRLVADFNLTSPVQGKCNSWDLNVSGAPMGAAGARGIDLVGASVNPGRYQIFARHGISNEPYLKLQINAGAANVLDQSNITMVGNEELLIGSVNISSGGTPTVRAFDLREPSNAPACSAVTVSNFRLEMSYAVTTPSSLVLETPGGSKITTTQPLTVTQFGQCNTWLITATRNASVETASIRLSGTSVNPGRYRLFSQSPNALFQNVTISATVGSATLANTGRNTLNANQPKTLGSINVSQGGTPTIRLFGSSVVGAS